MDSVTFAQETCCQVWGEVEKLAQAHWQETEAAMYGGLHEVIDIAGFEALEASGLLHITTIRDAGRLTGYAVFMLTAVPQMGGRTNASLVGLYLSPDVRKKSGGWLALGLLRESEKMLRKRGVDGIVYNSPHSRPCDALYLRLGAKPTETVFYKSLGE